MVQYDHPVGVVTARRMLLGKRMMMAPSVGFPGVGVGGGAGTSAFVSGKEAPFLRRRSTASTSTTTLPSAFSTTSLSSSASLVDDSFHRGGDQSQQQRRKQQQQRVVRADEPNLFEIPPELSPIYRSVPILLQLLIGIASALLVGRILPSSLAARGLLPLLIQSTRQSLLVAPSFQRLLSFPVVRKALFFLLRTALVSTMAKLLIQEAFYRPSRVTCKYLAERGELPSRLSKYTVVKPVAVSALSKDAGADDSGQVPLSASSWKEDDASSPTVPIGVHSIQYTQKTNNDSKHKYDGIYLHHGFGAMSLSWLPVLPSLVDRLGSGSAEGVAHDAPGFGFTDRPNANVEGGLEQYGVENNVGIGLALLDESLLEQDASAEAGGAANDDGGNGTKSIAIFGHSMGCKSALLTALHYASHPKLQLKPNLVVLVAPALMGVSLPSRRGSGQKKSSNTKASNGRVRKLARKVWIAWKKVFLDCPFQYVLRRVVCGTKDFWRKGLTLAWGNRPLSDSDILRFQWPSVAKGWEEGIINFARARILSSASQDELDDGQLLREVANLKNTKVVIIYGSSDKVVRIEGGVAETLKRDFPNVKMVRMEGLGHDPFEEDVNGFLLELEKALE